MRITGFPPVVNKSSKVIVLGSMPGVESLRVRQYYAHPRNQFWGIMSRLLKYGNVEKYADKKKMVLKHRIALWDVIDSCKRSGSLDSNLRDVKVNNFRRFLKRYSNIRTVFCNGQAAFHLFKRHCGSIDLPIFCLPSTSPAHAVPINRKLRQWRMVLKLL